jgi:hypothetical protein
VSTQRQWRRRGWLGPERTRRLNQIGFPWSPKDEDWETMFTQLKRYRKRFGDCNVPQAWKENPSLGAWVHRQRVAEEKGKLLSERKALLDALEFEWHLNKRRPAAE